MQLIEAFRPWPLTAPVLQAGMFFFGFVPPHPPSLRPLKTPLSSGFVWPQFFASARNVPHQKLQLPVGVRGPVSYGGSRGITQGFPFLSIARRARCCAARGPGREWAFDGFVHAARIRFLTCWTTAKAPARNSPYQVHLIRQPSTGPVNKRTLRQSSREFKKSEDTPIRTTRRSTSNLNPERCGVCRCRTSSRQRLRSSIPFHSSGATTAVGGSSPARRRGLPPCR